MELYLLPCIFLFLVLLVLACLHLRPLTENELEQLGKKRRNKKLRAYFTFTSAEFSVDKEFKKRMKPTGRFYEQNERLHEFPSVAAGLLKYKKHEWIIIAFERARTVTIMWLNKGPDKSQVSPRFSIEEFASFAEKQNFTSVLILHNHPNPNPNRYDCRSASAVDLNSAAFYSRLFNDHGANLLEFVCERGRHHRYALSPASRFIPLSDLLMDLRQKNGVSKLTNLLLHIERLV